MEFIALCSDFNISMHTAVKNNKLLFNSSVNATHFTLTDHHQAIKYIT